MRRFVKRNSWSRPDLQSKLRGKQFDRLKVLKKNGKNKWGAITWLCECLCGNKVVVSSAYLNSGHVKSCGCFKRENSRQVFRRTLTTHGMRYTHQYTLWAAAKFRAKEKGLPFSIKVTDIIVPEKCPLLGIPLSTNPVGKRKLGPGSPSLDRKIPELGYVSPNVWVISHRANTIKSNATLEELSLLVHNLRGLR